MEINTFRINYKLGNTFVLKPILDPHIGATASDVPAFRKYLAESDKKTYFMGFGDQEWVLKQTYRLTCS